MNETEVIGRLRGMGGGPPAPGPGPDLDAVVALGRVRRRRRTRLRALCAGTASAAVLAVGAVVVPALTDVGRPVVTVPAPAASASQAAPGTRDCGTHMTTRGEPRMPSAAVGCINRAVDAGASARLVVTNRTTEGDPYVTTYLLTADGELRVVMDGRRDAFGGPGDRVSVERCTGGVAFSPSGELDSATCPPPEDLADVPANRCRVTAVTAGAQDLEPGAPARVSGVREPCPAGVGGVHLLDLDLDTGWEPLGAVLVGPDGRFDVTVHVPPTVAAGTGTLHVPEPPLSCGNRPLFVQCDAGARTPVTIAAPG